MGVPWFWNDCALLQIFNLFKFVCIVVEHKHIIKTLVLLYILASKNDGFALPSCTTHAMSGAESVHLSDINFINNHVVIIDVN